MLTAQEQQELAQLEQEEQIANSFAQQATSLTPQEQQELIALEQEELFAQQAQQEQPSFIDDVVSGAVGGLTEVGRIADMYTGAPTRAALGELVTGQGVSSAASKFVDQFGADPSLAPTGKEIVQAAGIPEFDIIPDPTKEVDEKLRQQGFSVPEEPSAGLTGSGALGLAVDVVADPLNFIPFSAITKGLSKGAKLGAKGAAKGTLAVIDTATGSKIVSRTADDAVKAVDNVIEATKKRFNPSVASDYDDFVKIAEKNGIAKDVLPETVEFGADSTITNKVKVAAEAPGGDIIKERFAKAQNAVENALDRKITDLGGGRRLGDAEAGQLLLDSYNNATKRFFDQDFITNNKIINQNPGLRITDDAAKSITSKMQGLRKKAIGRVRRGVGSQASESGKLLKDIDTLSSSFDSAGTISYKQANEALQNIGEEAFKKFKGDDPMGATYRKGLQDIYFTMRDAMNNTVAGKVSPEIASELANSNAIISDFLKSDGVVSRTLSQNVAPEKIVRDLIDRADTNKIAAIQNIFGLSGDADALKAFKGFVADKIVKKGASDNVLYRSTINNLNKRKDILSAVFSPNEIAEVGEILKLGDRVGDYVFNTSRTNTAARFSPKQFLSDILGGAADEVTIERLKDIARGKAKAATLQTPSGSIQVSKEQAKTLSKRLPMLSNKKQQSLIGGRIINTQETNRKLEGEKRKRQEALR